jgi:hypothetical protein
VSIIQSLSHLVGKTDKSWPIVAVFSADQKKKGANFSTISPGSSIKNSKVGMKNK